MEINWTKVLIITAVVIILLFIISQPAAAAAAVDKIFVWLTDAGNSLIKFVSYVFS